MYFCEAKCISGPILFHKVFEFDFDYDRLVSGLYRAFFQNKKVVFGSYFHLPVASSPTHDHTDILYFLLLFLTTFAKIEFSYNFIDLMYF